MGALRRRLGAVRPEKGKVRGWERMERFGGDVEGGGWMRWAPPREDEVGVEVLAVAPEEAPVVVLTVEVSYSMLVNSGKDGERRVVRC
jgi:hypothetical protein